MYVESSAILAWLLGEAKGGPVREALAAAEAVVTADITLVECDRTVIRAITAGRIPEAAGRDLQAQLSRTSSGWTMIPLDGEVIDRARRPFPTEPIRTLDAVHLASALTARHALPGLALLSLDERVRATGRQLGFDVLPE